MDTQKLSQKTFVASASTFAGVAFGSMGSRILADKIPVKNKKITHGALTALGLLGTAMVAAKNNTGKAVQGAFAGVAATQGVELIKDFVKPEEGLLKTAMGNPAESPIVIYDNSFAPPAIDVSYEDVSSPVMEYLGTTNESDFLMV